MIDSTYSRINNLFVLSFKDFNDDPTRDSFDQYYMTLVKIKEFNALIDKPLLMYPLKRSKTCMKNFLKCQETMTIQQEVYLIFYTIKVNIKSLLLIYHDRQVHAFLNKLILFVN